MTGSPMGYTGFEDPENLYYGTSPTLPVLFTGAWQVRQFGVGAANTLGQPHSIASALANPPEAMTTAATSSATNAKDLYVVTPNDLDYYHAHA
jgi:hypothetical protein